MLSGSTQWGVGQGLHAGSTGASEHEMLTDYLCLLAERREVARAIGANAAAHIAREHAPEKVAAAYWNVLNTV